MQKCTAPGHSTAAVPTTGIATNKPPLPVQERYEAVESALLHLLAADSLCRPSGVGIFLSSGARFADTEPVDAHGHALELPKALLRSCITNGVLPGVAVILDVVFLSGSPYAPKRLDVFPIGWDWSDAADTGAADRVLSEEERQSSLSPVGVYHLTMVFGFAEEHTKAEMLRLLSVEVPKLCPHLRDLAHTGCIGGACTVRRARSSSFRAGGNAEDLCPTVSFVTARDRLVKAPLALRPLAAVYNSLIYNTSGALLPSLRPSRVRHAVDLQAQLPGACLAGRASNLKLPELKVIELSGAIDVRMVSALQTAMQQKAVAAAGRGGHLEGVDEEEGGGASSSPAVVPAGTRGTSVCAESATDRAAAAPPPPPPPPAAKI